MVSLDLIPGTRSEEEDMNLAGDRLGDLEGDRVLPPGLLDLRWKLILLQLAK